MTGQRPPSPALSDGDRGAASPGTPGDAGAATWERLDVPAATPNRAAGGPPPAAPRWSEVRLRRSRTPVLAGLDGGGDVFQRRMRDVLLGAVAILSPAVAVHLWTTTVAFDRFDPDDTFLPSLGSGDIGLGVEDVPLYLTVVMASLVTVVVGHYAAQFVIGERFATPVTAGRALGRTLRRLPALLVMWAVGHVWVPLAALFLVSLPPDETVGAAVVVALPAWFVTAVTLLAVPAMVGEELGPLAALRRGARLARLRYGQCLAFVLLTTMLSTLFELGLATLAPLLETTGFITFGGIVWIVQGILVQLGVLVVVPLMALATAQMYVEVRLDAEGLDLVIDADRAFGPTAGAGT